MRVLICGDRQWTDYKVIRTFVAGLLSLYTDLVVVEGEQRGADLLARQACEELGVEFEPYPADWARYKRAAGPIRNKQMLTEGKPNVVFAFHNDIENSKGTKNMLKQATKFEVPGYLVTRHYGD